MISTLHISPPQFFMCKGAHTGLGTGHNDVNINYSRYEGVKNAGGNVLSCYTWECVEYM